MQLESFADFCSYTIVADISAVAYRPHFTGWNAYRELEEHQFILIDSGKGIIDINHEKYCVQKGDIIYLPPGSQYGLLCPADCDYLDFVNVQFSYALIENRKPMWHFDTKKNFSVIISQKAPLNLVPGTDPLPFPFVQKATLYQQIKDTFLNLYEVYISQQIGYEWQCGFLFSRLLYSITKNYYFQANAGQHMNVDRLIHFFSENLAMPLQLDDMAELIGVSKGYLVRIFKEYTGFTPVAFFNNMRINRAKNLLLSSTDTIRVIARTVGICDEFYFSRLFKKQVGISPMQYRKENMFNC